MKYLFLVSCLLALQFINLAHELGAAMQSNKFPIISANHSLNYESYKDKCSEFNRKAGEAYQQRNYEIAATFFFKSHQTCKDLDTRFYDPFIYSLKMCMRNARNENFKKSYADTLILVYEEAQSRIGIQKQWQSFLAYYYITYNNDIHKADKAYQIGIHHEKTSANAGMIKQYYGNLYNLWVDESNTVKKEVYGERLINEYILLNDYLENSPTIIEDKAFIKNYREKIEAAETLSSSSQQEVRVSDSENKSISEEFTQFHKHGPNCMKSYSGNMTVNDIKASSVSSATTDAIYREYEVMKLFFNVNPIFIFSDEIPGPAFFPDLNFINKPLSFIYDYERKNYGKEIINAVLAHEFAHALQHKSGMYEYWRDGKKPELHADFLAGFYMGKKELLSKDKLTAFANEFYGNGDFDFFAPQHHGTPEERRCAFLEGYMVSKDYDFNIYQAYNAGIDYIRLLAACDAFAIIQDYSKTEIKNDYISPVGNYVFSSTQKEIYFCNVYGQPIGKASPDNKLYFNSLPVGVYTIIPAIRKPNGMLKYYSPYTFEVKQNNTGKFEINDVGTFAIRTYSISF